MGKSVRDLYAFEIVGTCGIPAMLGAIQAFGDLVHWHSHVHAISYQHKRESVRWSGQIIAYYFEKSNTP